MFVCTTESFSFIRVFLSYENFTLMLFYFIQYMRQKCILFTLNITHHVLFNWMHIFFCIYILYNDLPFMNLGSVQTDIVRFCQVFGKQWNSKVNCFWQGKTMFEHCLGVAWRTHPDLVDKQRSSICIFAA